MVSTGSSNLPHPLTKSIINSNQLDMRNSRTFTVNGKQVDRLPKAEYFALRLSEAHQAGLASKVEYYTMRLTQMGYKVI